MREAQKNRKTNETEISVKLNIDGTEKRKINTGIGLLDHMLDLFAYWGHFDLEVLVKKGDFNIDIHHTNEDVGIVLGQAFEEALGDKIGISRNGFASWSMEEATANVRVDISGRPSFKFLMPPQVYPEVLDDKEGYALKDAEHFLESFAKQLSMDLNIKMDSVSSLLHTTLEPIFKALGKALDQATQIDPRRKGVPSTKGIID